jgi:hypothetical protein
MLRLWLDKGMKGDKIFMYLYAPYSLLLISNKFWMGRRGGRWGVGGGEARGPSWRGRIKRAEG